MKGYQCDRCGMPKLGSGVGGFVDAFTGHFAAEAWPRNMKGFTVRVLIQPEGDPTGYGGMELCDACRDAIIALALGPIIIAGKGR